MTTLTLRSLRTSSLLRNDAHGLLKQQFFLSSSLLQTHPAQLRLASTSTSTAPKTTSSSKPLSKVNGPSTTLPAPLALPVRAPNQSFFPSYAFALGKAYASFYKTGVYNIYKNFQASRPLQRTLNTKFHSSIADAVSAKELTRSDFQLLNRNWHDIKRVPMFALVFLICGEFTPLVVIAISNIVPWTCRIPKQVESDRRKLEERRSISFRNLTVHPPTEAGAEKLQRQQLVHIDWSLGLSSKIWDWFGGLPNGVLRRKVRSKVQYLEMDDQLIREYGGTREMVTEEVRMACVDRGINVQGRSEANLKTDLGAWLKSAEKVPIERLLLTR
jgi:hypothetical protein